MRVYIIEKNLEIMIIGNVSEKIIQDLVRFVRGQLDNAFGKSESEISARCTLPCRPALPRFVDE